jgi:NAD(P)H dehydrogenase (quinone)
MPSVPESRNAMSGQFLPFETETIIQVLIIVYSRFGVLRTLADEIASGVEQVDGVTAALLEVDDDPIEHLRPGETESEMLARRSAVLQQFDHADALVVGAPAYFGSMASPVKRLFEDCVAGSSPLVPDRSRPRRAHLLRDKIGAAFTSSATPHGGNEQALHSILTMLMHLGMIIVTPGQREPMLEDPSAPYGATAITGATGEGGPIEAERVAARALGQRVAEVAIWYTKGRLHWFKQRDVDTYRAEQGLPPYEINPGPG